MVSATAAGRPVVYRAHELWSEATPDVPFAGFWRPHGARPRAEMRPGRDPEESRSRIYAAELGARRPPLTIRNCPPYRPPVESTRLRDQLRQRGIQHATIVLYQGLVDSGRCIEEIADGVTAVR
jgi:hypothetical protein